MQYEASGWITLEYVHTSIAVAVMEKVRAVLTGQKLDLRARFSLSQSSLVCDVLSMHRSFDGRNHSSKNHTKGFRRNVVYRPSFSWHFTRCTLVVGYRRFRTIRRTHLQGSKTPIMTASSFKIGPIRCTETSLIKYQPTPCNIPG